MLSPRARAIKLNRFQHEPFVGGCVKASPMERFCKTHRRSTWPSGVIVEPDSECTRASQYICSWRLEVFSSEWKPLPGVAPVAMQSGQYVAALIQQRLKGKSLIPFRYFERGNLAVIGRNAAVVDLGFIKFSGFLAWLAWVFVHIYLSLTTNWRFSGAGIISHANAVPVWSRVKTHCRNWHQWQLLRASE